MTNILRQDVRLPVSLGEVAASVIAPPDESLAASPVVLFCVPGMTYRRSHFDLQIEGYEGYSFAERMISDGHLVVTVDNLGTGDSSRPDPSHELDLAQLGAANAQATAEVRRRLAEGTLIEGLRPRTEARLVGVAHSMGGGVTVAQQATRGGLDGLVLMGFTTQALAGIYEDHPDEATLTFEQRRDWAREHIPQKLWGPRWEDLEPYFSIDRAPFHAMFYADDVPAAVIAHDDAAATVVPRQAALDIITPQLGGRYAAEIEAPVLVGFSEVDLSPDPRAEVSAYARSGDITLYLLERAAHCQNVASSRGQLWDRIGRWLAVPR